MPAKTKDQAMQTSSVYYGDCVKHLEPWRTFNFELLSSACSLADLIYLDPPWNSNTNYNILWDKGPITPTTATPPKKPPSEIFGNGTRRRQRPRPHAQRSRQSPACGTSKISFEKSGQSHGEFGKLPPRNRRAGVSGLHG